MQFRRKHSSCLNCGYSLSKVYNYCPNCGQENTDANIPFPKLVGEFLSNYFALDSRFGRTFKPFFLKPGFLTNEFMAGKRNSYAHPIRMYLVISLIFFAVFSISVTRIVDQNNTSGRIQTGEEELKEVENLPEPLRKKLSKGLDDNDTEKINSDPSVKTLDNLRLNLHLLSTSDKEDVVEKLTAEEAKTLTFITEDEKYTRLPRLDSI